MALAESYGITEYPAPAGGCLLTDPIFSLRLKELLSHNPSPDMREVELLKTGRHFRLGPETKIVIGRNKKENEFIEKWILPEDSIARVIGFPGPMAVAVGKIRGDEDWERLAQLCLTYSDAPGGQEVAVQVGQGQRKRVIRIMKVEKEVFREMMISQ